MLRAPDPSAFRVADQPTQRIMRKWYGMRVFELVLLIAHEEETGQEPDPRLLRGLEIAIACRDEWDG